MALTVEEEERARERKADSQNIPGGGAQTSYTLPFLGLALVF